MRNPVTAAVVRVAVWLAVFTGGMGIAGAAQDVVITTTGDRLVGEIKSVDKDVLTLETDYSDVDFKIKWEKIASIESDRQFLVETFDGTASVGFAEAGPARKSRSCRSPTRACRCRTCRWCSRSSGTSGRASTRASTSATA